MSYNVCLISLGCSKNLVESERILYAVKQAGYDLTSDIERADIAIINTCGFISAASLESIEQIVKVGKLKKDGKLKYLIVTGCLVTRYKDDLLKEMPEIDALISSSHPEDVAKAIKSLNGSVKLSDIRKDESMVEYPRVLSTPSYMAYLKIAEGCNNRCSFCAIPYIKGRYRSRTIESIVREAEKLSQNGVKEIVMIAQDTARYGIDIYNKKALGDLLKEIVKVDGIRWIRILYCYPEAITEDVIDIMANEPKVCHYLDIPIQHSSDKILKSMHRQSSKKDLTSIIEGLKEKIPDIVLRTTLMVGYPGENEEDFNELLGFMNEMQFDNLGVFSYSREEGTEAYSLPGQVKDDIKAAREKDAMLLQRDISYGQNSKRVGNVYDVLIEQKISDGRYKGRYYGQAPEVDGCFYVNSKKDLDIGSFVKVFTKKADIYDLEGDVCE